MSPPRVTNTTNIKKTKQTTNNAVENALRKNNTTTTEASDEANNKKAKIEKQKNELNTNLTKNLHPNIKINNLETNAMFEIEQQSVKKGNNNKELKLANITIMDDSKKLYTYGSGETANAHDELILVHNLSGNNVEDATSNSSNQGEQLADEFVVYTSGVIDFDGEEYCVNPAQLTTSSSTLAKKIETVEIANAQVIKTQTNELSSIVTTNTIQKQHNNEQATETNRQDEVQLVMLPSAQQETTKINPTAAHIAKIENLQAKGTTITHQQQQQPQQQTTMLVTTNDLRNKAVTYSRIGNIQTTGSGPYTATTLLNRVNVQSGLKSHPLIVTTKRVSEVTQPTAKVSIGKRTISVPLLKPLSSTHIIQTSGVGDTTKSNTQPITLNSTSQTQQTQLNLGKILNIKRAQQKSTHPTIVSLSQLQIKPVSSAKIVQAKVVGKKMPIQLGTTVGLATSSSVNTNTGIVTISASKPKPTTHLHNLAFQQKSTPMSVVPDSTPPTTLLESEANSRDSSTSGPQEQIEVMVQIPSNKITTSNENLQMLLLNKAHQSGQQEKLSVNVDTTSSANVLKSVLAAAANKTNSVPPSLAPLSKHMELKTSTVQLKSSVCSSVSIMKQNAPRLITTSSADTSTVSTTINDVNMPPKSIITTNPQLQENKLGTHLINIPRNISLTLAKSGLTKQTHTANASNASENEQTVCTSLEYLTKKLNTSSATTLNITNDNLGTVQRASPQPLETQIKQTVISVALKPVELNNEQTPQLTELNKASSQITLNSQVKRSKSTDEVDRQCAAGNSGTISGGGTTISAYILNTKRHSLDVFSNNQSITINQQQVHQQQSQQHQQQSQQHQQQSQQHQQQSQQHQQQPHQHQQQSQQHQQQSQQQQQHQTQQHHQHQQHQAQQHSQHQQQQLQQMQLTKNLPEGIVFNKLPETNVQHDTPKQECNIILTTATQVTSSTATSTTTTTATLTSTPTIQTPAPKPEESHNALLKKLLQNNSNNTQSSNQLNNTTTNNSSATVVATPMCNQLLSGRKVINVRAPSLGLVSSLEAQLARPVLPPLPTVQPTNSSTLLGSTEQTPALLKTSSLHHTSLNQENHRKQINKTTDNITTITSSSSGIGSVIQITTTTAATPKTKPTVQIISKETSFVSFPTQSLQADSKDLTGSAVTNPRELPPKELFAPPTQTNLPMNISISLSKTKDKETITQQQQHQPPPPPYKFARTNIVKEPSKTQVDQSHEDSNEGNNKFNNAIQKALAANNNAANQIKSPIPSPVPFKTDTKCVIKKVYSLPPSTVRSETPNSLTNLNLLTTNPPPQLPKEIFNQDNFESKQINNDLKNNKQQQQQQQQSLHQQNVPENYQNAIKTPPPRPPSTPTSNKSFATIQQAIKSSNDQPQQQQQQQQQSQKLSQHQSIPTTTSPPSYHINSKIAITTSYGNTTSTSTNTTSISTTTNDTLKTLSDTPQKSDAEIIIEMRKKRKREYQKNRRQLVNSNKELLQQQNAASTSSTTTVTTTSSKKRARKLSKFEEDYDSFIDNLMTHIRHMQPLEIMEPQLNRNYGICNMYGKHNSTRFISQKETEFQSIDRFLVGEFGNAKHPQAISLYDTKDLCINDKDSKKQLTTTHNEFYDQEFSPITYKKSHDKLMKFIGVIRDRNVDTLDLIKSKTGAPTTTICKDRNLDELNRLTMDYPGLYFTNHNTNQQQQQPQQCLGRMSPVAPLLMPTSVRNKKHCYAFKSLIDKDVDLCKKDSSGLIDKLDCALSKNIKKEIDAESVILALHPSVADNIIDVLKDLANLLHVTPSITYKVIESQTATELRTQKRLKRLDKPQHKRNLIANLQLVLNGRLKLCRNCGQKKGTISIPVINSNNSISQNNTNGELNITTPLGPRIYFCSQQCQTAYEQNINESALLSAAADSSSKSNNERLTATGGASTTTAITKIDESSDSKCKSEAKRKASNALGDEQNSKKSRYKYYSSTNNTLGPALYKRSTEKEVTDLLFKMDITLSAYMSDIKDARQCVFCNQFGDGLADGPSRLLNFDVDKWVHLNCALWSNGVYETISGGLMNFPAALQAGINQSCSACQQMGATVKCFKPRCGAVYHLPCAIKESCTFYKNKTIHCQPHASRLEKENELTTLAVQRRVFVERDENRQVAAVMHYSELSNLLRVGSLTFLNVGQLLPHQLEAFHTSNYIYPIGYKVVRFYWSMHRLTKRCRYICSIAEVCGRPEFRIQVQEPMEGDIEFRATTPKAVWQQILEPIANLRKDIDGVQLFPKHINGEDLFGLTEPAIVRIIESLPGIETLTDYRFKYGRNPLLELPLAINPSGSARTEQKQRQLLTWRKPHTQRSGGISAQRLANAPTVSVMAGEVTCPYSKQFVHSKSSQYKKMKQEWRNNVFLARSKIQGLGLYAARDMEKHTMIIEYIGEVIRTEVSEIREKQYEARNRGIYMFRLDEDRVVDATLSGGLARYINHSCNPNCVTEIVEVDREFRIIIFAKRRVHRGEELSYDYKFDIEDDANKIPCMCGAPNCRKWMN